MEMTPRTPEFDRLAFTVLAIEASAQKMNIYDTLHTESREAVANDVVEALKNWEGGAV